MAPTTNQGTGQGTPQEKKEAPVKSPQEIKNERIQSARDKIKKTKAVTVHELIALDVIEEEPIKKRASKKEE